MKKEIIPVVFAANDGYTYFCYTAIYSLIKYSNPERNYKIHIFVTSVSEENCRLLESLSNDHVEVVCMDISSVTAHINLKESLHLSIETYYRLFIPLILPQYDKVLYLDSDMCMFADVADLYEIDTEGFPVAAALDVLCEILEKHSVNIGGLDCRKTFNAGVLLIDNKIFEEQKIREKCLKLLEEDYKRQVRKLIFADQDALNIVLYENYKQIDKRWNYQIQYLWRTDNLFPEYVDEYISTSEKAYIMHYAGDKKPWMYTELPKADTFWRMAKETPIFLQLLSKLMSEVRVKAEQLSCFEVFQFPYEKVPYKSRVAIYAAGMVGKAFVEQLNQSAYAECVLWVDKNADNIQDSNIANISKLKEESYHYVIIAIDNKSVAEHVKSDLLLMGIEEKKIVWDEYKKKRNG